MSEVINSITLIDVLKETAAEWSLHSDEIGQLDAIIGDGDMGVTVKLGSLAMTDFLAKPAEEDIGKLLMKCGMQINRASPSTFGTLLASAFMEAGKSALGRKEIEFKELALLGQGAIEGVKKRGKAKVGEKTMMDSLVPAVEALECALTKGAEAKAVIESANAQFVGHWGGCHASPVSQDFSMVDGAYVTAQRYSFSYGIMVNRCGERFVDEGENFYCWIYNRYGKDILRQPGSVAYQIFDGRSYPLITYKDALKTEANTLEELAQMTGIDPAGFVKTIKEFNAAIANDEKPFVAYELDGRRTQGLKPDKTNWAQKIDTPPYRAFTVVCGLTMTYGGMKVDEFARVIDTSDRPIKGLYAVGEMTGGYFYHTYLGGSGLIRGVVMGRIAAADAVANLDTRLKWK